MTFTDWDPSIHREPEQVSKRAKAAKEVEFESLDLESKTAIAKGSEGNYSVSLERCDCSSFVREAKPCKHMYCLASKLGLIEDLPKSNRIAAATFKESIPSEVKRFEELYFGGAISVEKYVAIVKALKKK